MKQKVYMVGDVHRQINSHHLMDDSLEGVFILTTKGEIVSSTLSDSLTDTFAKYALGLHESSAILSEESDYRPSVQRIVVDSHSTKLKYELIIISNDTFLKGILRKLASAPSSSLN